MNDLRCRSCETPLKQSFVDLGMSPLANSYLKCEELNRMEAFYPLHAYVCEKCLLVQVPKCESPERIFSDYAYFSSYSDTWLEHVEAYSAKVIERFGLNANSLVVEIACNDGCLLQCFKKSGIPVLGVEPARNVAQVASNAGIPIEVMFLSVEAATELAAEGKQADLLIANNVMAHVPDLNDFIGGMKIVLKPEGIITIEFTHLQRMMEGNQFDSIYHEHFSYFSLITAEKVLKKHGLTIFDVEKIPTHGGSLRLFVCHTGNSSRPVGQRVIKLRAAEVNSGFIRLERYLSFAKAVQGTKYSILEFFVGAKRQRKTIAAYGAPAKGNTLLNYCGIRADFVDYTVDRSPHKQGLFLPGTHIPIFPPTKIKETRPDYLLILPWNLKDEIMQQMAFIRDWGGQFVTLIPEVTTYA
ncbi:MAG: class I SAM-dependent methyltransferase [Deltaproteobacteria bacterium]|nr:class I SAM-dependent methyltransferase [Deltaproteobacteria bacterium]